MKNRAGRPLCCCRLVLSFRRDAGVGHSDISRGGIGCGVEWRADVAWCLESGEGGGCCSADLGQRHRIRYQVAGEVNRRYLTISLLVPSGSTLE